VGVARPRERERDLRGVDVPSVGRVEHDPRACAAVAHGPRHHLQLELLLAARREDVHALRGLERDRRQHDGRQLAEAARERLAMDRRALEDSAWQP